MLLCLSTCRRCCLQLSEEGAGEVAFEAADGVAAGFAFAEAAAEGNSVRSCIPTPSRGRDRYRWRVLAYCLMGNHFHLLAMTLEPTLARGDAAAERGIRAVVQSAPSSDRATCAWAIVCKSPGTSIKCRKTRWCRP